MQQDAQSSMPKISVIVPIYNVEKYLKRCLESLRLQTLKDIEIILVDDGSSDECPNICEQYSREDKRFRTIHKKNEGLGFARNTGILLAKGEFIAFVDSDDYVSADMYEIMYNAAKKNSVLLVASGRRFERPEGVWHLEKECEEEILIDEKEVKDYILNMVACLPYVKKERLHQMSCWRFLYSRKIINQYQLSFLSEREVVSEDVPFQIDYFSKMKSMVLLPNCFYNYCLNNSSLTSTFQAEKFCRYKKLREIIYNKILDEPTARNRVDRCFIGQSRQLILQLASSTDSFDKKYKTVKKYLNDDIWKELISYKPLYLPLFQGLFHWFCIHRLTFPLLVIALLASCYKKHFQT